MELLVRVKVVVKDRPTVSVNVTLVEADPLPVCVVDCPGEFVLLQLREGELTDWEEVPDTVSARVAVEAV